MDFMDRNMRQPQQTGGSGKSEATEKKPSRLHRIRNHKLLNITYVTLLFSITILLVGVVLSIFLFDGNNKEEKLVDTSKYQAVFLNGGQVYFGKVTDVNTKYMSLADIYYLTPNQAAQTEKNAAANNFTIRKLGCELHRPQDVMVINHDQIIFWENLKDDSSENTVPGAIKKLSEQTQDCNQPAATPSSTDSNSSNSSNTSDTSTNGSTSN